MYVGVSGLGKKLGLSKRWRRNLQSLSLSKQLGWWAKKQKKQGAARVQKVQDDSAARQAAGDVALQKQLANLKALTPELLTPETLAPISSPKTPATMGARVDWRPWLAGGAAVVVLLAMLPKGKRR